MTDRARALFFASLVLVAGELALPGRAGTAITAEAPAPVVDPVEVQHDPQPASYGARSWLPDSLVDRLVTDAPSAPSRATSHPRPPVDDQAAEPSRFTASTDPFLLLPPSRAPPALS